MILKILFNIALTCVKNSLPFRGQPEFTKSILNDDSYLGNFLSVVQILGKIPAGTTRYLSLGTQNEIIECLSKQVL